MMHTFTRHLAGLLLLSLLMALVPLRAPQATAQLVSACPDDPDIAAILALPAISRYTQMTIARAEAGLDYIKDSNEPGTYTRNYFFQWASHLTSAIYSLVDADITVVQERRSLEEYSACLNIDMLLLESEIEKIRCEINHAFESISIGGIIGMKTIISFLQSRSNHLLMGALNPQHQDETWHRRRFFDDPTPPGGLPWIWCCLRGAIDPADENTCRFMTDEECIDVGGAARFNTLQACLDYGCTAPLDDPDPPEPEGPLCPFSTNYLLPNGSGYGCDTEVLAAYTGLNPVNAEYTALQNLMAERDTFIAQAGPVKDLTITLNTFMGRPVPDLSTFGLGHSAFRVHREEEGCADPGTLSRLGAAKQVLRGPFSFRKNEAQLMSAFGELRAVWGSNREQADYLKLSSEFTTLPEERRARGADQVTMFLERALRMVVRWYMRSWSIDLASNESTMVAKGLDAQKVILQAFEPTHRSLAPVASDLTRQGEGRGARTFATGLAWLLRRSCVFRPCNERLENTLKILLTDSCFPYTSGEFYLDRNVHETCPLEAGL